MSGVAREIGATYRLQVRDVGFTGATRIIPYLSRLGIETLDLSPIFRAHHGSPHGCQGMPTRFCDVLSGTSVEAHSMALGVGQVLSRLPVAPLFGGRAVEPHLVVGDALPARGSSSPLAGITRSQAARA